MADLEQASLLEEAQNSVKEQAFYMKKALDSDSLRDALKCASNLICELRTSLLSPKAYYTLYMSVFQELQHLEAFFSDKNRHRKKMADLYESVQHAGNILPRLYLLATVGSAYIRSREAPAKDILKDLTELCKGVQQPMRGLFLRYYLVQMCKDKLPDSGSIYEAEGGGSVYDAFDFLLTNFAEATRLWARIQHSGGSKDRARRERERNDLKVLVGAPLVRLSQLEGMTNDFYSTVALPKILEEIVSVKDEVAEEYLLDCVIQVFSDELHLATLDTLLAAFSRVSPTVQVHPILTNLMTRLASFIRANESALPPHTDIFSLFCRHLSDVADRALKNMAGEGNAARPAAGTGGQDRGSSDTAPGSREMVQTSFAGLLELQLAFLRFTSALYPERRDYLETILQSAAKIVQRVKQNSCIAATSASPTADKEGLAETEQFISGELLTERSRMCIVSLLSCPMDQLGLSALRLPPYQAILASLDPHTQREVAKAITRSLLERRTALDCPSSLENLLKVMSPLFLPAAKAGKLAGSPRAGNNTRTQVTERGAGEEDGDSAASKDESDAVAEESEVIGCLVHAIGAPGDPATTFQMLVQYRMALGQTLSPARQRYLIPPMIYAALRLARPLQDAIMEQGGGAQAIEGVSMKKLFQFIHRSASAIIATAPDTALKCFLQAAIVCSDCDMVDPGGYEPICYEFLSQALVAYEDELPDSKVQVAVLPTLVGTLVSNVSCLEQENYETLANSITQHAGRLFRKPDQCRGVLACSRLFWVDPKRRNSTRVVECLQKAVKTANAAVTSSPLHTELFIEVLESYIYFFEQGNEGITADNISSLVALCTENISMADSEIPASVLRAFERIREHLRGQIAKSAHRYSELQGDHHLIGDIPVAVSGATTLGDSPSQKNPSLSVETAGSTCEADLDLNC